MGAIQIYTSVRERGTHLKLPYICYLIYIGVNENWTSRMKTVYGSKPVSACNRAIQFS